MQQHISVFKIFMMFTFTQVENGFYSKLQNDHSHGDKEQSGHRPHVAASEITPNPKTLKKAPMGPDPIPFHRRSLMSSVSEFPYFCNFRADVQIHGLGWFKHRHGGHKGKPPQHMSKELSVKRESWGGLHKRLKMHSTSTNFDMSLTFVFTGF